MEFLIINLFYLKVVALKIYENVVLKALGLFPIKSKYTNICNWNKSCITVYIIVSFFRMCTEFHRV